MPSATLDRIQVETRESTGTIPEVQPGSAIMHRRIHKVAVLGAGTMGARIAAHLANAGVPCYLLDIVPPDATSDPAARSCIAAIGLEAAKKSKPAAFFEPSLARLIN